jgi:hypothetical protein
MLMLGAVLVPTRLPSLSARFKALSYIRIAKSRDTVQQLSTKRMFRQPSSPASIAASAPKESVDHDSWPAFTCGWRTLLIRLNTARQNR